MDSIATAHVSRRLKKFKEDLKWCEHLLDAVAQTYDSGNPRHVTAPHHSRFEVLIHPSVTLLEATTVQRMFSKKHLIVMDMALPPYEFDHIALNMISTFNMNKVVRVRGAPSLPCSA